MSQAVFPNYSTEWLESYYQHHPVDHWEVPFGGITSDSISDHSTSLGEDYFPGSNTMLTTSSVTDQDAIYSHDNSQATNDTVPHVSIPENSSPVSNDLSPKVTISKPVKRRSRASRRTPTTVLNASIKNFRTLVQQYTGWQSGNPAAMIGKGPITLSFSGSSSSSQQNDFYAPSFATSYGPGGNYFTDEQAQFQENIQLHYRHEQQLGNLGWQ